MKSLLNRLSIYVLIFAALSCQHQQEVSTVNTESIKAALQLTRAEVYVTAKDSGQLLHKLAAASFHKLTQPDESYPTLMLDPGKRFQTIEGFGGAITDASAETFYKLPESIQQEIITAYYDPVKGIGYTMARTHINSCDFSSKSYAYAEVENDVELKHFSIEPDRQYRIPMIKRAIEAAPGGLKMLASPWSPPAWMKTNNHMLQGGKLKPEYAQTWAEYFVKFTSEYEKEGIPIWGYTVQNEPMAVQTWESCIYTAEEERDFVKNHLGPTLHKAGLSDKKLVVWDHNRGIMYQRAKVVYDDPEASKYVWGTGFHWYVGDHFENVKLHNEAFPDKKLLFTEGCVYPFNYQELDQWHWGERYGESILNDLNNSTVGWIDWNILLDETGGPNHVHNYCFAPLVGNTQTGELIYMNSYYYLGHFSKFIRPGAQRIVCSSNYDDLQATAMVNPDGSLVVVALNLTDAAIAYKIWINGKAMDAMLAPHAISTVVFH
jgi:glucosylceramidase